nr:copia protein [Tanacetum cinerariifolium]
DDPHKALKDKGIINSGCSRHMTGNKAHLADYQEFKGGYVAFGGSNGKITGKRKIKAARKESNTRPLVRPRQFSWVYFLKSKDETTTILKNFVRQDENQFNHKVKTITSDNGIEFKNHNLIELCGLKGIKREYSNARTPQQNGVAEQKNRTLIESAKTMNKKDERGVVVRNKARLVAQGHRQEEGIDYDEVFALVASIEAIRIFLAFASYMGFIVYQMDVKSAFLYGIIDEEVYVTRPPGFVDPKFPNKVYKVVKALYGLHQAPRAWFATFSTFLERSGYRRGAIDKTLFIKQDIKDIMLVQVYVDDIIFGSTKKSLCDEFEELMKNRSMIGSLMYLTASRPDIMFAVCACSRFQTIVATSTTKVEYVVAAHCSALLKGRLLEVTTAKQRLLLPSIAKPVESEGFEQIIDFLNGSSVRYAFTVSPTICTSCIKQFWSTAKVKTVNDEVRVQALIDEIKVTIKESSIRRTLRLDDEEGTSCLTNDDIFTGLANIGYEKMSDKLTFYQAFFSPQWKFVQLIVDHKLGDMSYHQDIYDNPSLTKKVFANMKRVGTGFSGAITPLFESMLVQAADEVGEAQDDVSIPTKTFTSKPRKKHKSKKQQRKAPKVPSPAPSPEHQLPSHSNDPILTAKDSLTLQELMDLCIRLSNKVLDLESKVIDLKSSFTHKITKLEDMVHKLEEENRILKDKSFKTTQVDTAAPVENIEKSFKQGRMITDIDKDVDDIDEEEPAEVEEVLEVVKAAKLMTENDVIEQVKRSEKQDNVVMRYQALKRKPVTEAQARKNIMIYLKNMAGFKMDFFKGNKRQGKSLKQEIAKKQRMDKEVEELKRHLQIVTNDDDDDVYTEATPLASKPNVEANVCRDQKGRYGLAKKMLDNVRLEVEEESEISLELLRLVRRQGVVDPYHRDSTRTFNQRTVPKHNDLKEKINTAETKAVVSVVQGNRENVVKSSACWIWRPTRNVINHISKDSGSYMLKRFNYVDLQGRLKSVMAWVRSAKQYD